MAHPRVPQEMALLVTDLTVRGRTLWEMHIFLEKSVAALQRCI